MTHNFVLIGKSVRHPMLLLTEFLNTNIILCDLTTLLSVRRPPPPPPPLSALQVEEEKKLLLDPYFINRDAILISYLTELSEVQKTLVKDLESVTWTYAVRHAVLPAMQWVVFSQERVVYSLDEIVTRNTAVS